MSANKNRKIEEDFEASGLIHIHLSKILWENRNVFHFEIKTLKIKKDYLIFQTRVAFWAS